jgi:hypothetical protein
LLSHRVIQLNSRVWGGVSLHSNGFRAKQIFPSLWAKERRKIFPKVLFRFICFCQKRHHPLGTSADMFFCFFCWARHLEFAGDAFFLSGEEKLYIPERKRRNKLLSIFSTLYVATAAVVSLF